MAFISDVAFAMRTLRSERALVASVVATLGIAIAATAIIATVANQALLEPLPYGHASRLLIVWEKSRGNDYRLPSYPTFLDWERAAPRSLAGLGYARGALNVPSSRSRRRLCCSDASPSRPLGGRHVAPRASIRLSLFDPTNGDRTGAAVSFLSLHSDQP